MHLYHRYGLFLWLLLPFTAQAGLFDDVLDSLNDTAGSMASPAASALSDQDIVAGIKQALQEGAKRAVKHIARPDGYWKNVDIRISLPDQWQQAAKLMRQAGMGSYVDDLELRMNRAAEASAPKARPIFTDAVKAMTFDDVRSIWQGPDDAATRYFEKKTHKKLTAAFSPVVHQELERSGAVQSWRRFSQGYASLPLVGDYLNDDLDAYVTDKALQGLFLMLGREEAKVRHDPAARTTELLRKVFQ